MSLPGIYHDKIICKWVKVPTQCSFKHCLKEQNIEKNDIIIQINYAIAIQQNI